MVGTERFCGNDVTLTDVGSSVIDVTVLVTGGTFTYDSLSHGAASSSVTAADGFTAIPTLVYYVGTDIFGTGSPMAPVNAGLYTVVASFAGDSRHHPGSASALITINKANAVVTVNGFTGTYDAAAHGATGSVVGVTGDLSAAGSSLDLGAGFSNAPGGTASWTFSGGQNYNDQSGSVEITINKATQTIVWSTPSAINYGTALSSTQLNATVSGVVGGSTTGALTYTPSSGTVLSAGTQTLNVTAAETTNYLAATQSVTLIVNHVPGYTSNGFLDPIRHNRAFKQGSTISVKWQVYDAGGSIVTSLSAITSLAVTGPDGTTVLYPGNNNSSGNTILRNDGSQYIFNWQTKGFALGNYTIRATLSDGTTVTEQIMLSTNGSAAGLMIDGVQGTPAVGALLAGDLTLYVDNYNGMFSADQLARIQDAISGIQLLISPWGTNIFVVDASVGRDANIVLDIGSTSVLGGMAEGVLGVTTSAGQITIITGWNWYAGANPEVIGSGQFDFQTVITHEIAHSLGLGHSSDTGSVMFPELRTGVIRRTISDADLNLAEEAHNSSGVQVEALYTSDRKSAGSVAVVRSFVVMPAGLRSSLFAASGTSTDSGWNTKLNDQEFRRFAGMPPNVVGSNPYKKTRSVAARSGTSKLRATLLNDVSRAALNGGRDSGTVLAEQTVQAHDEDLFGPGADWWLSMK